MKNTVYFCLLAVAAITTAPFSRASADTFCIGGAIFTDLDHPIDSGLPGVSVTVEQVDGPFADIVETGTNGIWVMCDVPEGTHTVMPTLVIPTLGRYCFIEVLAGPTLGERCPITIVVDAAHEEPNWNIKFLAEWCPDDGLFCTGPEICDQELGCISDGDPCGTTGLVCDEDSDQCICTTNGQCDDGLYCNGTETCDAQDDCQAGTAVDCDDAVDCTDDSCNEGTGSCDNVPNDALCDDGVYCNGAETCDAELGCQPAADVDCDDAVGCTDDSCNEDTDSCDHIPNDELCTNGYVCDPVEGCIPEEPGACCLPGGCLQHLTREFCEVTVGGVFAGGGTDCNDEPAPCDFGACCVPEACIEVFRVECIQSNGTFQGPETDCDPNPCPGACCYEDPPGSGSYICIPDQLEANCLSVGGEWVGVGIDCEPDLCPVKVILSAASCLVHDDPCGEMCLPDDCADDSAPYDKVEPRLQLGTPPILRIECDGPVPAGSASCSVSCVPNDYDGYATVVSDGTEDAQVQFSDTLAEQSCCTLTFTGDIQDIWTIVMLEADVNKDGQVSTADYSSIKQRLGDPKDESNFWYDINRDCMISTADLSSCKARLEDLAPVPCQCP